jgi:hypothetical protein
MKPWTFGDKRRLRRLAPIADAATIAGELGRSVQAVRTRASLLGIQLQKRGALRHVPVRKKPPGFDRLRKRVLVRLRWEAGGVTKAQLAARYRVAWSTVDRWVSP